MRTFFLFFIFSIFIIIDFRLGSGMKSTNIKLSYLKEKEFHSQLLRLKHFNLPF